MNSLVPIRSANSHNAQTGVNICVDNLKASVKKFDAIAARLVATYKSTADEDVVVRFVEVARYLCTGKLDWR